MELVVIVIAVALLQYNYFAILVGKARGKYEVNAPAVTGHEVFERHYRVQQNTLELLMVFIPGIVMFAQYIRADIAAGLGVVFIIGRFIYNAKYVSDPKSRGIGFALSWFPSIVLVIGGIIGAIMNLQ